MSTLSLLLLATLAPRAEADAILVNKAPTEALCCLDGASSQPRGAFVLAGSFVFDGPSGTLLRTVGAYMQRVGDGSPDGGPLPGSGTPFGFDVMDDRTLRSCAGEPTGDVCSFSFSAAPLAQTQDASHFQGPDYLPSENSSWTLVAAPLDTPVPLLTGSRYWVLVSTFFLPSQGSYLVGARPGSGELAASFDPALQTFFDAANLAKLGSDLDPALDLSIYASGSQPVPEPGALTLIAIGTAFGWRVFRRRPELPVAQG